MKRLPAVLLVAACAAERPAPGPVYADLLADVTREIRETFPEDTPADTLVLEIEAARVWPEHLAIENSRRWGFWKRRMPSLRRDTYDDFWIRNLRRTTLPRFERAGDCKVVTIAKKDVDAFFEPGIEEGWRRFHARFPRGLLVACSAMGFSRDGRQALVYLAFPGWTGSYFVIAERDGRWRIADEWNFWVS